VEPNVVGMGAEAGEIVQAEREKRGDECGDGFRWHKKADVWELPAAKTAEEDKHPPKEVK
jgi:hypothetical protein